jgi:hypothetical protein
VAVLAQDFGLVKNIINQSLAPEPPHKITGRIFIKFLNIL